MKGFHSTIIIAVLLRLHATLALEKEAKKSLNFKGSRMYVQSPPDLTKLLYQNRVDDSAYSGYLVVTMITGSYVRSPRELALKKAQFHRGAKKAGERIVGAEKNVTDLNELPYFVSIQTREYGNWIHYCSGAIYDGYTVITSAECRVDLLDRVVAGKSKLGDTEIGEQMSDIRDVITYSEEAKFDRNNLALIKLETPFTLSDTTYPKPIRFPDNTNAEAASDCRIGGWDNPDVGRYTDYSLQSSPVNVIDDEVCMDQILDYYFSTEPEDIAYYTELIEDYDFEGSRELCAVSTSNETVGICGLDSGSPLICKDSTGKESLFGIAVMNLLDYEYCRWHPEWREPFPNVFTEVSQYADWIREKSAGEKTQMSVVMMFVILFVTHTFY